MSLETQMLRNMYGADRLATLAESINDKAKGNPAVEKAGNAFSAQLKANLSKEKVDQLEAQLKNDPKLAGKIEALVLKDPNAFERVVPNIVKNPNSASTEIDMASGQKTASAAVKPVAAQPAAPAPKTEKPAASAPRVEEPSTTKAAEESKVSAPAGEKPADKPTPIDVAAAPAGTGPSAGSPPSNFTGRAKTTEEKIAELQTQPGFSDLMNVVGKNEHMRQALQNGMNQKDPNAPNGMVDMVYDQVREEKSKSPPNNNYLKQTAERLEKMPPGLQSTFGRMMADSPNGAMSLFNMMSPLMDGADQNGMMGSLFKGDNAFGKALQSILPMIAKVMEMFTGKSVKDLKGSSNLLATENKPGMTDRAVNAAGANPANVTRLNPDGTEIEKSGDDFRIREAARNNPNTAPGMQPQPS